MDDRPVLYLDLDDTLLSWSTGSPRAAPGAAEFVRWAMEHFEVRWLTRWCPGGRMPGDLLQSLCKMLRLEPDFFASVRGVNWQGGESKLNGIAWLEHLVLGRAFFWVEDEYGVGERELRLLSELGLRNAYRHCNVTRDAEALLRVRVELDEAAVAAAPA